MTWLPFLIVLAVLLLLTYLASRFMNSPYQLPAVLIFAFATLLWLGLFIWQGLKHGML